MEIHIHMIHAYSKRILHKATELALKDGFSLDLKIYLINNHFLLQNTSTLKYKPFPSCQTVCVVQ